MAAVSPIRIFRRGRKQETREPHCLRSPGGSTAAWAAYAPKSRPQTLRQPPKRHSLGHSGADSAPTLAYARRGGWEGPGQFLLRPLRLWSDAPSEKRGTHIDRHLTSHSCRTSFRIVSGQVVTISDAAVARWARNGSKKTDRMAFCVVFGRFLGEAAHMLPRFL